MNIKTTNKIELNIESDWWYTNIVALFDREDFLRDITIARINLGMEKPDPWEYKEHFWLAGLAIDNGYITSNEYNVEGKRSAVVNELILKYKKPVHFWLPIYDAVVFGRYDQEQFQEATARLSILHQGEVITEPKMVITISPMTKITEIEKLFKERLPDVLKLYKREVVRGNQTVFDTHQNIRRDREWYWLHKEGKSYNDIVKLTNNTISKQGVVEAIKDYTALLTVNL